MEINKLPKKVSRMAKTKIWIMRRLQEHKKQSCDSMPFSYKLAPNDKILEEPHRLYKQSSFSCGIANCLYCTEDKKNRTRRIKLTKLLPDEEYENNQNKQE